MTREERARRILVIADLVRMGWTPPSAREWLNDDERRLTLLGDMADTHPKLGPRRFTHGTLSQREVQVLESAANGRKDRETADKLGIATDTVKKHLRSARNKLRARNTTHAAAIAAAAGWIAIE